MLKKLYFNTVNAFKREEIAQIFSGSNFEIKFLKTPIVEILSHELEEVIFKKAADAYMATRTPVIVEHGALQIDYFNGFPGALSKPMWDLMNTKICEIIPLGASRSAKAVSAVCYCDGKRRITTYGETLGSISEIAKGSNGFQWDPIFIPEGETKTYAEMELSEKLSYSQAKKAYFKLLEVFKTEG